MIETLDELADAIARAIGSRFRNSRGVDDLIQEGQIAAWHEFEDSGDYGRALQAGIWRAYAVAKGNQTFGAPERSPGSGSRLVSEQSYAALGDVVDYEPIAAVQEPQRDVFAEEVLALLEPVERFIVEAMMAGYVHADIAEALDRSVAAVRKRMPTIRAKLAPVLEDLRAS